jgi:ferredoxin
MLVELLLAKCPSSKTLQDLAAKMDVQKVRFPIKYEDCILCGLCVRMCEEQMMAKAIGFVSRGTDRKITTPFDIKSDECRTCGACLYICPVCQLRCQGPEAPGAVCGACLNLTPTCLEHYDDAQCFMSELACGTCVRERIIESG